MSPARIVLAVAVVAALRPSSRASAHELRPAYLEIEQTAAPTRYRVLWRAPASSGAPLPVVPVLPDGALDVVAPVRRQLPDSLMERRIVDVRGGLTGRRVVFAGLEGTITEVLVRVHLAGEGISTTLVRPSQPWIVVAPARGPLQVARTYLEHGVEHILLGYDHLLFLLALVLIIRGWRRLAWTITAFTVAHSITLGLATLGAVSVPVPPVEAAIALSVLLLAVEVGALERGQPSTVARRPWLVAFCFGLLHGFGFAGALTAIGLPAGDVPLALFSFNAGVEAGQLAFIGTLIGALGLVVRLLPVPRRLIEPYARLLTRYGIGAVAAFWFLERLASL